MTPFLAARSAYAAETFTRAAMAPTAPAVVPAAAPAAPLTTPVAAPSGGTAAGRVGLAVPLARGPRDRSVDERRRPGVLGKCGRLRPSLAVRRPRLTA